MFSSTHSRHATARRNTNTKNDNWIRERLSPRKRSDREKYRSWMCVRASVFFHKCERDGSFLLFFPSSRHVLEDTDSPRVISDSGSRVKIEFLLEPTQWTSSSVKQIVTRTNRTLHPIGTETRQRTEERRRESPLFESNYRLAYTRVNSSDESLALRGFLWIFFYFFPEIFIKTRSFVAIPFSCYDADREAYRFNNEHVTYDVEESRRSRFQESVAVPSLAVPARPCRRLPFNDSRYLTNACGSRSGCFAGLDIIVTRPQSLPRTKRNAPHAQCVDIKMHSDGGQQRNASTNLFIDELL